MKKQLKKIRFRHIVIATLIFVLIYFAVLLGGSKLYLQNKYDKDFKFVSMRLPYYPDTADFFDWPIFYKPGEKVPFTVYYTDGDKNFTVIHQKFKYFDDYQLEEISKLSADYFRELTGCDNIDTVLFVTPPGCFRNVDHGYPILSAFLKTDNRRWDKNNIEELIFSENLTFNENCSDVAIILREPNFDLERFEDTGNKINRKIIDKRKQVLGYYDLNIDEDVFRLAFVNYELQIERVSSNKIKNRRFDWYGLKNDNDYSYLQDFKSNSPDKQQPAPSEKFLIVYE